MNSSTARELPYKYFSKLLDYDTFRTPPILPRLWQKCHAAEKRKIMAFILIPDRVLTARYSVSKGSKLEACQTSLEKLSHWNMHWTNSSTTLCYTITCTHCHRPGHYIGQRKPSANAKKKEDYTRCNSTVAVCSI